MLFALSSEGETALGAPLRILAGESAGESLARVFLALRDQGIDVRSKIACIMPCYPIFDLTYTPSLLQHDREAVLSCDSMMRFVDTAFPDIKGDERTDGSVSSLYADLRRVAACSVPLCDRGSVSGRQCVHGV